MIVRNEEHNLRDCLESVKDIADEIVIIDTGSTDQTIKIANEYKAKVYPFKWINDFAAARNYALSKSSGNWILYLDADERLNPNSIPVLQQIIEKEEKAGYRCEVISKNSYKSSSQVMYYTRLFFYTPGIKFTGIIHEQIDDSLVENAYKLFKSSVKIDHIGYDLSDGELRNKAERNLSYLLREYSLNPSSYNAYQIGNTYQILNEEHKAFDYYSKAVKDIQLSSEYIAVCYLQLSSYKLAQNKLYEAANYCHQGIAANPDLPQLQLVLSEINFRSGRISEACVCCMNSLELNEKIIKGKYRSELVITNFDSKKPMYQGIYIAFSAMEKIWLNNFLVHLKQIDASEGDVFQKIISNRLISDSEKKVLIKSVNENNVQCILAILERYNYPDMSLNLADSFLGIYPDNSKILTFAGKCYTTLGDKETAKKYFEKALQVSMKDASAAFYLISVLFDLNELSTISSIISFAEREFADNPEVLNRILLVKQKLQPILNTIDF